MPKISALTSLAQADVVTTTDVLPIVDATAPATTKKVTVQAMVNAGLATLTTLPSGIVNASLNSIAPTGGTLSVTGSISATGGTVTGPVVISHAAADNNSAEVRNTSATGYGLFSRGGSSSRYAALFVNYDATVELLNLSGTGNLGLGVTPSAWGSGYKALEFGGGGSALFGGTSTASQTYLTANSYFNGTNWIYKTTNPASNYEQLSGTHNWYTAPSGTAGAAISFTQAMTLDASGNLLVGTSSGTYHTLRKNVTANAGNPVAEIQGTSGATIAIFYGVSGYGANAANAAAKFGFDNVTSRSINAGGTINASGADAAEYERNGGLKIAKGQIVGFGPDGVLTDKFDSAIRFGVKSTNPHLVGGDTWGAEGKIGKRPDEPQFEAPEYTGRAKPEDLPEDATEEQASQHARDMANWNVDQAEYKARTDIERNLFDTATYPEYLRDKAAFEERLEAARQQVDRVAYCGKVPCNVQGATPGDYIVAVNDGSGGIKGLPVRNPTFEQYRAAVGRVNRILPDGRAEIAVIVH